MKKAFQTFLFLAAGAFTGGCEMFCDVADFEELARPVVEYRKFQEGVALHVAGRVRRANGNAVEYVRQLKDGKSIHIEVLVSPFERDDTGHDFSTDVFLDGVDLITFGNNRTLLWRRTPEKGSPLPSKNKPVFDREDE